MSESDHDFPASPKRRSLRRQPQTQQPDPLRCPRCESTNTKFCYFNNYNKTQPRYFCKSCKRHWTKGGTLRNVPIGGSRKNKRLRQTTITTIATVKNNRSIDQDCLLPSLSGPNETFDVSKDSSFMETIDGKRSDDVESYTDIEELKGFVSWDFCETFTGCRMQDFGYEDLSSLGFSKMSSVFETNPRSSCSRSFIEEPENGEDLSIATNKIMLSSQEKSSLMELNSLNWINDLDIMVFEDLNKPWEDPTFKT